MNKRHGEVNEEGVILAAVNEVEEKVGVDVRAEIRFASLDELSVLVDLGLVEAARFLFCILPGPHTIFVEAVLYGLIWMFVKLAKLPLSGDGCFIAGSLEVMSKGFKLRWHARTCVFAYERKEAGSIRILARHDHHAGGRAEGSRVGVVEECAFSSHLIQSRRGIEGAVIAVKPLSA